MSTDERLAQALREALDERAARVEPGDRLDEILRLSEPARRGRTVTWWMPLAAAAAVLAVISGVWIGVSGRPEPLPGGTESPLPTASTSPTPSASPTPSTEPTTQPPTPTPSTTPTTSPTSPTTSGTPVALPVYYLAPIGDDARVARLYREWLTGPGVTRDSDDAARARAAVGLAMTATPAGTDGYLRTWDGVDLVDLAVTDGRITITLSGPGGSGFPEDTERVSVQQLVWTAQAAVGRGQIPVRFALADGSSAMFGSQPVDRTYNRPESRDEYWRDLAPIWVTSPTRAQSLPAGRVTVAGEASVFEATVSWQLLRDGAVVDEGFTNASVGAPGRGTYEIGLARLEPGSYAVRVFELSAEDGARVTAETTMPFTVR
jgi:hypothetical protein